MPHTIQAIFIQRPVRPAQPAVAMTNEAKARRVHADLLREYGLPTSELPLLLFEAYPQGGAPAFIDISSDAGQWLRKHPREFTELVG